MMIPRNLTILALSALLLSVSLYGCAARESIRHQAAPTFCKAPPGTRTGGFWWAYRFKVSWPPGADPDFAVDLLLAHAVVQPVLREYEGRVTYWRFHRRAAPDKTGHQFSFMFYSSPDTADEIFRKLGRASPSEMLWKPGSLR